MNRITHSLVGYDRQTERTAEEFEVPDAVLPRAKELARVPAGDPDAIMCYPLDAPAARDLADILRAGIDPERCDYFLEGFAGTKARYEFADDAEFRLKRSEPEECAESRLKPPEYSVWIHNDAKKDHVEVVVARRTLDDYASKHGHKDHCAVIDLLNVRITNQVQEIVNRAIDDGRAIAGPVELNGHDLGAMLNG